MNNLEALKTMMPDTDDMLYRVAELIEDAQSVNVEESATRDDLTVTVSLSVYRHQEGEFVMPPDNSLHLTIPNDWTAGEATAFAQALKAGRP